MLLLRLLALDPWRVFAVRPVLFSGAVRLVDLMVEITARFAVTRWIRLRLKRYGQGSWLMRDFYGEQLAPDDAYLSCEFIFLISGEEGGA